MSTAYELRAAAHLNNSAVSLLKNKCYRQALKTFGDALQVVRAATTMPVEDDANTTERKAARHSAKTEEKIRAAAHRLAKPEPSVVRMAKPLSLEIKSDDELPIFFKEGVSKRSHTDVMYLIRMENNDFGVAIEKDLAITSAQIFYNFGICYRCLASPPYLKRAMHMFRFAHSTLSTCPNTKANFFESQGCRMSVVSLFILCQLEDLSKQLGMKAKGKEYSSRLQNLRYNFSKFSAMEKKLPAHAARAA